MGCALEGHSWLMFYQHLYKGACHVIFMHFVGEKGHFSVIISQFTMKT